MPHSILAPAAVLAGLGSPVYAQCSPDPIPGGDTCATALTYDASVHGNHYISGSGASGGADEDWFHFEVPPSESLYVRARFVDDLANEPSVAEMLVLSDDCSTVIHRGPIADWVSEPNLTGAAQTFRVGLVDSSSLDSCAWASFLAYSWPDPCDRLFADSFEPDDTVGTGHLVGPGTIQGLTLTRANSDYFLVDVPRWTELEVTATQLLEPSSVHPMGGHIFDAVTGEGLAFVSGPGPESVGTWVNEGPDTRVAIQLDGSWLHCSAYDLAIELTAHPCSRLSDDPFEAGDDCGHGDVLMPGTYSNLWVDSADPDSFTFPLAAHTGSESLVHVEVLQVAGARPFGLARLDCADLGSPITGSTFPGEERTSVYRPAGSAPSLELDVLLVGETPACALYDLQVTEYMSPIGSEACTANTSRLELWGSAAVGDNALTALVSDSGPLDFPVGIQLFVGSTQVAHPVGPGLLCVGGHVQRIYPDHASQVFFVGDDEPNLIEIDLDSGPASSVLMTGTSWVFQGYIRFVSRPYSLTNAVVLTLE